MRITKTIGGAALAVLLGLAAVGAPVAAAPARAVGPAPEGGPSVPVTHVIALDEAGLTTVNQIQVEPTTGRFLISGSSGPLAVFEPDGSLVDTIAASNAVSAYGSIYYQSGPIWATVLNELDPSTLEVTRTWELPEDVRGGYNLHAAHGALYWQSWIPFSNDWTLHRFDLASGTYQATTVPSADASWVGTGGIRAGLRPEVVGTAIRLSSGLTTVSSSVSVAAPDLVELQVGPDGKQLAAASPSLHTVQAVDVTPSGLVLGAVVPFEGSFGALAVGPQPASAVAIQSSGPDGQQVVIHPRGSADPLVELAVESTSGRMVFAPDGSELFVLQQARASEVPHGIQILAVDLATVAAAPSPSIVGRAGGATITVPYDGVAPVGANIGDIAAPSTVDAGQLTAPVPPLPVGAAPVQLVNALGMVSETPVPLQVVELGPYGTVAAFVSRQYADVLGRKATPTELAAATADLAAGGLAGELPADLVRSRALTAKDASLVRLYRAVFKRLPDTSGYRYWLGRMDGGTTLVKAAATFAASSEFQRTYGKLGHGAFVDLVYQNVLGRPPDPTGRAYWLRKLAAGTSRGTLVAQFSQSSEYVTKTTDLVQRVRLVLAMFDRMPKQAELDFVASFTLDQVAQSMLTALQYPAS